MSNVVDRNSVGWIAQDVSWVFPNAVQRIANEWFPDFHALDVDQIYKTMYGALSKVIADKEALETRVVTLEAKLATVFEKFPELAEIPTVQPETTTTEEESTTVQPETTAAEEESTTVQPETTTTEEESTTVQPE
jgi:hypothetical protein